MRIRQTQMLPVRNSLRELPAFGVPRSRGSEEKPPKGGIPGSAAPASLLRAITRTALPGLEPRVHAAPRRDRLKENSELLMSRMGHSSFDHSFDIRHSSFPVISPRRFPPQHFPGRSRNCGTTRISNLRHGWPWEWSSPRPIWTTERPTTHQSASSNRKK
jgi:hypothetical protein